MKKHTPVPRGYTPSMGFDKSELKRAEETYSSRIASPEEMEEIIAKYGPPRMPLGSKSNVMHIPQKGKQKRKEDKSA